MDAVDNFPNIDFSSIKLNLAGAPTSSLLQTSSEDVNIEDDATTQPRQDDQNTNAPPTWRRDSDILITSLLFLRFSCFVWFLVLGPSNVTQVH